MSKKQKSFVAGAALLGGIGLIVKLIGAAFRIPLTNIIGPNGMANYHVAYPLYTTLLVISTAGLPTAISRMVSERVSIGDYNGAHKVFITSFKVLLVIGLISTVVLFSISGVAAQSVGIPTGKFGLLMIAPALLFVSLISAYRGYFQGLQMMAPTAFSQLIEQVVKLGAGLYLASLMFPRGDEYGAAGALLGISISEAFALLFMIVVYGRKKRDILELRHRLPAKPYQAKRSIPKDLLVIALPMTLGGCIMPLIGLLDAAIITNTLLSIGFTQDKAEAFYGVLTGPVNTLVNMPAVLSLALCMSLVPAISEARVQKDQAAIATRSGVGFKLAVLVGLPCAAGMFLLARPIIDLLYGSGRMTAEALSLGAELLKISAISVLFLTMLQTMTGILQGTGHQFIPLRNLLVGAVVKIVLSIVLIRNPELNIRGASIGTAACYGITALLNIVSVIRRAKPETHVVSDVIMPLISTGIMGIATYFLFDRLSNSMDNTFSALIAIAGAIMVYVLMLLITGSLSKRDMPFIPGGGKLTKLMNKLGFWRN